jgi:DNA modification methylase
MSRGIERSIKERRFFRMMEVNQIYNEDCLHGLKRLEDGCIDMCITSPPYDNLRDYEKYSFDVKPIAKELFRVLKEGGVIVWIIADATIDGSETGTSFKQALCFIESGFLLNDTMIWDKGTFRFPHRVRYRDCFEYMFIFTKGKPKLVNLLKDRKNKYAGQLVHGTYREKDGSMSRKHGHNKKVFEENGVRFNIWRISNVGKRGQEHPAVFPKELVKDHLLSWSKEGDLILDIFMGSGTTALACMELSRDFIGFEISEKYCKIANTKLNGGKFFSSQP